MPPRARQPRPVPLREPRRFACHGAHLARPLLPRGADFPEDSRTRPGSLPATGFDESLALRSAGNFADRLRRGGASGAAAADPQILREDARWPGQRRRGVALHQSRQPHPERAASGAPATTASSRNPTAGRRDAVAHVATSAIAGPARGPTSRSPAATRLAERIALDAEADDARTRARSTTPDSPNPLRRSAARRSSRLRCARCSAHSSPRRSSS